MEYFEAEESCPGRGGMTGAGGVTCEGSSRAGRGGIGGTDGSGASYDDRSGTGGSFLASMLSVLPRTLEFGIV